MLSKIDKSTQVHVLEGYEISILYLSPRSLASTVWVSLRATNSPNENKKTNHTSPPTTYSRQPHNPPA